MIPFHIDRDGILPVPKTRGFSVSSGGKRSGKISRIVRPIGYQGLALREHRDGGACKWFPVRRHNLAAYRPRRGAKRFESAIQDRARRAVADDEICRDLFRLSRRHRKMDIRRSAGAERQELQKLLAKEKTGHAGERYRRGRVGLILLRVHELCGAVEYPVRDVARVERRKDKGRRVRRGLRHEVGRKSGAGDEHRKLARTVDVFAHRKLRVLAPVVRERRLDADIIRARFEDVIGRHVGAHSLQVAVYFEGIAAVVEPVRIRDALAEEPFRHFGQKAHVEIIIDVDDPVRADDLRLAIRAVGNDLEAPVIDRPLDVDEWKHRAKIVVAGRAVGPHDVRVDYVSAERIDARILFRLLNDDADLVVLEKDVAHATLCHRPAD